MRVYFIPLLLCLGLNSLAQGFGTETIPDPLKEGANAVVRISDAQFEIMSIDKAEFRVHRAVTILNEQASDEAFLVVGYDKLSSLSEIEVSVFDASGKRIKKVKSSEINDRSAYTGNLFDDSRIKYVDLTQNDYPYTIEYKFKKRYKFLYSIPPWYFIDQERVSVQVSRYTLKYPEEVGARWKETNFNGNKKEYDEEDKKVVAWEMTNLKARELEKYGPSPAETLPSIHLGVSKFSFEGYEGDMSTWDGIAEWQKSLNQGRNKLSQNQIREILELTKGLNQSEKIKAVYEYVQQNTRYVSIQLGVGGFQPFPASTVEENGYGDCKALSFYTQSLLNLVGVKSYYSWVYGGRKPPKIDRDFPLDNFNHIILAVPHEGDTIWLECTSQTNPLGYLGTFTGDREALLINDDGGHIVKTTSYPAENNISSSSADVKVDKEGNATIDSKCSYEGIMANDMLQIANLNYDDQKDYLEKKIDISTFDLNDFKIQRKGSNVQRLATLWVNKLLSKSGSRLFLQPNVMNKKYFVPLKYQDRETDIVVSQGYHLYDTVNFEFPAEFRIEATFDPIVIESEFGVYRAEIIANEEGKFQYIRHYMQQKGRFDAVKYSDYLNFHKKVVRADKRKIALISGT